MEQLRTFISQAQTGSAPQPPPSEPGAAAQTILGLSVASFWLLFVVAALIVLAFALPKMSSKER